MSLRLTVCMFWLVMGHAAFADRIHKWVDGDGNVHFGDRPPSNVRTEVVTVKPNVYVTPTVERLEPQLQVAEPVVLYSASWCGYCRQARAHFRSKGIPFAEYDVETSAKGRADFARLGARGVPVILVGNQRLSGFSPEVFDRLYAARGR